LKKCHKWKSYHVFQNLTLSIVPHLLLCLDALSLLSPHLLPVYHIDSTSKETDAKITTPKPMVVPPMETSEEDVEAKFAEQTAHAVSSSSSAGKRVHINF